MDSGVQPKLLVIAEEMLLANGDDEQVEGVEVENRGEYYYQRIEKLTYNEVWGMEFSSEKEAIDFYNLYARLNGLYARKNEVGRDSKGVINMRQMICNREELRHKKHYERLDRVRDPRSLTRTCCEAKFQVQFQYKLLKWKVVNFVDAHNHPLTPVERVHLIPGYRGLNDGYKAQVNSLHLHGVQTSHICGFIVGKKGGQASLGFCKKDLYNHIDRENRVKIEDGDAFSALCYIQATADNDEVYYAKFTTTDEGRLEHLSWSDGGSRLDYQCFGDVVAFDMTYKKIKYNRPLVIFCGYNHHGETIIFAFALVADESSETYKWVLRTFCEAMFDKHPEAIVTYGDHAMREAVKEMFPSCVHIICAWHIKKNATENVKNIYFLQDFNHLIYSYCIPAEFEDGWRRLIEKYSLGQNRWLKKVYKMKNIWAKSYMRDKFFLGIRTTSVCEGINSFIKRYVKNRSSLVDLMHNLERAVKQYKYNELVSDFKSSYYFLVISSALYMFEEAAAKIYTSKNFKDVKEEIDVATRLNVVDRVESDSTVFIKVNGVDPLIESTK